MEILSELKEIVSYTEPKIAKEKGFKPISKPKEPLFLSSLKCKIDS
jgi:hypothetical protein